MYTIEKIEQATFKARLKLNEDKAKAAGITMSSQLRRSSQVQGFLTDEQVIKLWKEGDRNQLIWMNLAFIGDEKKYFISDDHTYGTGVLPKKFVHASLDVCPQHHLENLEAYLKSLKESLVLEGETQLQSVQELVDYLNDFYMD